MNDRYEWFLEKATEIGIQGGKRMVKKANFTDKSMPFATILANSEERVLIAESVKAYADEAVRLFGLENETKESYYRVADAIGSAKDAVSVAKPIGKITKEAAESVSGFSLFLKNMLRKWKTILILNSRFQIILKNSQQKSTLSSLKLKLLLEL